MFQKHYTITKPERRQLVVKAIGFPVKKICIYRYNPAAYRKPFPGNHRLIFFAEKKLLK